MWTYEQSTGQLYDANMNPVGAPGYSGHPPHVNDPNAQNIPFQGPIPQGVWNMVRCIEEGAPQGPVVIVLAPDAETETYGRDGFLVHGDLVENPGAEMASEGCIILTRMVRQELWNEPDHKINVVPTVTTKGAIQ
jgi:hypothetical protein